MVQSLPPAWRRADGESWAEPLRVFVAQEVSAKFCSAHPTPQLAGPLLAVADSFSRALRLVGAPVESTKLKLYTLSNS